MQQFSAWFREAGAGVPVVCLHSSASSSAQFRPLMNRLASRFYVVAPDLYGYGQSPPWPAGERLYLADEVGLLESVFDACGNSVHLVGHSYGAAVALKAAFERPHRIRSLTLFEPVLFSVLFEEDPDQAAAREIASLRADTVTAVNRGELADAARRFVDYWMGDGTWAAMPEKRRAGIVPAMRKVKEEWHALIDDRTPLAAFASLAIDTRFIVGGRSPLSTKSITRLLAQTLPRAETIELEGVGHMGPVTHPDHVDAVIEGFYAPGAQLPGASVVSAASTVLFRP